MEQEKQIEKPIFIVEFYEDEIQSFAEANFGRELTGLELHRMQEISYEDDRVGGERMDVLDEVIRATMEAEGHWIDEEYKPEN
jgi:hypothetical protein